MNITIQSPKKSLNKAYLKEKVSRDSIELFKKNLSILLSKINELESEEHHKYPVSEFLKNTWYKDQYEINTKGRSDFVIHSGKSTKEPVSVILEVKRPSNKAEMISSEKINVKAMHELILYYLRERIDHKNSKIKHLIVTNIYEWCILDENWFEKNIFRNTKLRSDYEDWKLSGKDTKFFYESIARPFLETVHDHITYTWFDIRNYSKALNNKDKKEDINLIALYKILSPSHLLKQAFSNDSNSLDTKFYSELLHILGLEEKSDTGKKLIDRKQQPNEASLLENTIMKLEDKDCLKNVINLSYYGNNKNDQLFNISLELCITWVNRILFLKLLEAQLFKYHKADKKYLFLNSDFISDYGELNDLFFLILAEKPDKRRSHIKEKFKNIPYLNSSLFERTDLEKQTFDIGALDNKLSLNIDTGSILKDNLGKKQKGNLNTLNYLFNFLEAYDFNSEGSEGIQEENKNLINASVLGLIFEKINGYKDGSFFTPGFITMFMCKQSIRKAVLQKFNDAYTIDCENFNDLKNFIQPRFKVVDILAFNKVIDSLKICDPAVGSGHFLVSALNEIISIKAELGILADETGVKLSGYQVNLENDELIITFNDNTEIFEYTVSTEGVNRDVQKVQKTLFLEKQKIIENSLFGVDINANSVKICSLRLWIELLKHAYYTEDSGFLELETLPNIDINIKHGNSLVNRFELDTDLATAFKNTDYTIIDYKNAVTRYKETKDKIEKEQVLKIIEDIKNAFKDSLDNKFLKKLSRARGQVTNLETDINNKKQWNEKITKELKNKLAKAKNTLDKFKGERDSILYNINYKDAFEWRFEFPEVLDIDCSFKGFDVVIGNPPYGVKLSAQNQLLLNNLYAFGTTETAILFIKRGFDLLSNKGIQTYIIPKSFTFASNYKGIRDFTSAYLSSLIDCGKVWPDVKLEVCIFELNNFNLKETYDNLIRKGTDIYYSTSFDKKLIDKYDFFPNDIISPELELSDKILRKSIFLNDIAINKRGEGLQRQINSHGSTKVLGGIDIGRLGIKGKRGYFNGKNEVNSNGKVNSNSVLVQNIVAHITQPKPHIKIIACLPDETNYYIMDTINQITVKDEKYSNYVVWALLNSKLINWFVYLFIYGKAIRTMHFDNVITTRLPIPAEIKPDVFQEIELITKSIISNKCSISQINDLENRLNSLIYAIYNLNDEEISIIEPNSNYDGQTLLERGIQTPLVGSF